MWRLVIDEKAPPSFESTSLSTISIYCIIEILNLHIRLAHQERPGQLEVVQAASRPHQEP